MRNFQSSCFLERLWAASSVEKQIIEEMKPNQNPLTQSLAFPFIFVSTYENKSKETAPEEKALKKELETRTNFEIKKIETKGKVDVTAGL